MHQTCFEVHEDAAVPCKKETCRFWVECGHHMNCALIGARAGTHTLQEIGEIFGITRMRVCQIEREIKVKCRDLIDPISSLPSSS